MYEPIKPILFIKAYINSTQLTQVRGSFATFHFLQPFFVNSLKGILLSNRAIFPSIHITSHITMLAKVVTAFMSLVSHRLVSVNFTVRGNPNNVEKVSYIHMTCTALHITLQGFSHSCQPVRTAKAFLILLRKSDPPPKRVMEFFQFFRQWKW